jgi:tRNA(Ile)-lysidine synthase
MIHLVCPLPDNNKFFVACSGGVDSMAVLHWLAKGNRMPYGIIHVHHNTGSYADQALAFVTQQYQNYCFDLFIRRVEAPMPAKVSKEAWWREQRYKAFQDVLDTTNKPYPIILAHNLDDCLEQFIISTTIRIKPNTIIPYNGPSNTIRPFRTWLKSEIIDYAKRNNIDWIEDPSNKNTNFLRNKVRHDVVPLIRKINPGIDKHIKNLIITEGKPNVL